MHPARARRAAPRTAHTYLRLEGVESLRRCRAVDARIILRLLQVLVYIAGLPPAADAASWHSRLSTVRDGPVSANTLRLCMTRGRDRLRKTFRGPTRDGVCHIQPRSRARRRLSSRAPVIGHGPSIHDALAWVSPCFCAQRWLPFQQPAAHLGAWRVTLSFSGACGH